MYNTIKKLIVVAALLFGGVAFAADETGNTTQPAEGAIEATPMPVQEAVEPAPIQEEVVPEIQEQKAPEVSYSKHDIPTRMNRSKTLDLRYCLELPTNVEIAKCAGE